MRKERLLVLPLLSLVATGAFALPGGDAFPIGPLGGSAFSVAVDPADPSVVLVAKSEGVLRSTDGGASFEPSGIGLPSGSADSLTVDPQDPQHVYVIASDHLHESFDFGLTWSPLPLSGLGLEEIAVPTSGPNLLVTAGSSVWHSTDSGATWTQVASGTLVRPVVYAPSDPTVAYHGTIDGVFKSTDGGATWVDPGPFSSWTKALTVSPTDANLVFAGSTSGPQKSTDGAATFTPATSGLPGFPSVQLFGWAPGAGTLWVGLLDGMWFTTDLGASWQDGNAGFPSQPPIPLGLDFDSNGDALLVAEASNGGFWRTFGARLPWVHAGFAEVPIFDVLVGGPNGDRAVSSFNGIFAGAEGETVSSTVWQFDFGTHTEVMVVDPRDPDRWITGGVGSFIDNAQIAVLTNGGASAQKTYEVFGGGRVMAISFDPSAPNVVLAGIFPGGFGAQAIVRSTNAGQTWTEIGGTAGWATRAIAHDPFQAGRVIQLSDNNQWAESTDGGVTWTSLNPAWPASGPAVLLAFDPFVPGVLYRGDEGMGLQRSSDDGATWSSLGVSLGMRSDLELSPQFPGLLFVTDADGHVKMSGDGGSTFVDLWDTPEGSDGTGLALDLAGGDLVVGTTGASAWELPGASPYVSVGPGTEGAGGFVPRHFADGGLPQVGNAAWGLAGDRIAGGAAVVGLVGLSEVAVPFAGGTIFAGPPHPLLFSATASGAAGSPGDGSFSVTFGVPAVPALVGVEATSQFGALDPAATAGVVLSNGVRTTILP